MYAMHFSHTHGLHSLIFAAGTDIFMHVASNIGIETRYRELDVIHPKGDRQKEAK